MIRLLSVLRTCAERGLPGFAFEEYKRQTCHRRAHIIICMMPTSRKLHRERPPLVKGDRISQRAKLLPESCTNITDGEHIGRNLGTQMTAHNSRRDSQRLATWHDERVHYSSWGKIVKDEKERRPYTLVYLLIATQNLLWGLSSLLFGGLFLVFSQIDYGRPSASPKSADRQRGCWLSFSVLHAFAGSYALKKKARRWKDG